VDPYRDPHEKPQDPRPAQEEPGLGPARATYAPPRTTLLDPAVLIGLAVVCAAPILWSEGWIAISGLLVVGAAAFAWFAWYRTRLRRQRVVVHAEGIAVHDTRGERQVRFDEVDEVWWKLDQRRLPWIGKFAVVVGLRLVEHGGVSHRVPVELEGVGEMLATIERRCSKPLESPALDALRRGEPLHFGPYTLDETGLRTRRWSLCWEELREVRLLPGQVKLFRWRWVAWKTISLDAMPHPTVFLRVMQGFANRVAKANGLPPPTWT